MKKLLLAFGLLFFAQTFAQGFEPTLLWKITVPEKDARPSYLYGTIHAICELKLSEEVQLALRETRQLYLEIKMDDPELQAKMMQGAMMQDGKTTSQLLSKDDAKLVSDFLQNEAGFNLAMVDGLKPMLLSSMLLPKMLDCPMLSVEGVLMENMQKQSKYIFGLETIEEQLRVFDQIPYDVQANELLKMAKDNMAESREQLQTMLTLYQDQNIQHLYDFTLDEGDSMMATYQDILLNNRNRNWIPIIMKTSSQAPTFFAVGAAHLAGDSGVINLLRKEGYKVEPVMMK